MPYTISKKGTEYAVKNTKTKKTYGFTTKAKAESQLRLLNMIEHGFVPKKNRPTK